MKPQFVPPSMLRQWVHRPWLVVRGKLVDDGLGCGVHADDFDLGPRAAKFLDDQVQRLH
jgi:hypothetical protein